MIGYFRQKPSAVQHLWDDLIEALIQVTYSSANKPAFEAKARDVACNNLTALIVPNLKLNPESAKCGEFYSLLPLAIFARRLYPDNGSRTDIVTKRMKAAYRACGLLVAATGIDLQEIMADKKERPENLEVLFDLYIWSLCFTEAELCPDVELPVEAREFGPEVWKYFETLQLAGGREFEEGAGTRAISRIQISPPTSSIFRAAANGKHGAQANDHLTSAGPGFLDRNTSSARAINGSMPFSISAFLLQSPMSTGTPLPS